MSLLTQTKPVTECFLITTGKLNSNAAAEGGKYPFFTCAKEVFAIDKFAFDQEALLLAGNNAQGDYDVKHYKGRFNAYQRTYVLTLANDDDDYGFYRHALQLQLENLKRSSKGTNTKYITMEILARTMLPVPSPKEQKRIAAILDKADAIRRKRQQAIQLADEFLRSVFLDMFGDPISNPKGWSVRKLEEISLQIGSGSTPKGGKENYVEKGIMFFRSQNVWKRKLLLDDIAFITNETHRSLKKSSLKNGDILMTKTGRFNTENSSLGRAAMFVGGDDSANVNGHVYLIRLNDEISNDFVLYILTTDEYRDYIRSVCVGGIDKRQINKNHLEEFPIIFPSIDLQNKFAVIMKAVEAQKEKHIQSLKASEDAFNALSQKAFSGEL